MTLNFDLVLRIIVSGAYLLYFFEVGIPNLVCGCILGWQSVIFHFWVTVTLTSDLVFRIIMSRAYLLYYYTPCKLCLLWVYCFHVVRASVHLSVTFCFLNILKSLCWIFIKPCKHVHICKTNTLDKKVRARGQFY